jgi:starch-binding outer membrane protein, SusD/RagB family
LDARRWLLGDEILGGPVFGVDITQNPDDTFTYEYPEVPVEGNRIFEERMYLYPIPQAEISKTGGLIEQNPNW